MQEPVQNHQLVWDSSIWDQLCQLPIRKHLQILLLQSPLPSLFHRGTGWKNVANLPCCEVIQSAVHWRSRGLKPIAVLYRSRKPCLCTVLNSHVPSVSKEVLLSAVFCGGPLPVSLDIHC